MPSARSDTRLLAASLLILSGLLLSLTVDLDAVRIAGVVAMWAGARLLRP